MSENLEHPLVTARRHAEAFHVLYWIDHDGKQFVLTIGPPDPRGAGMDNATYFEASVDDALTTACRVHDATFPDLKVGPPRPAMKFHYTDAAQAARG